MRLHCVVLLMLVVLCCSCGKQRFSNKPTDDTLVGEWVLSSDSTVGLATTKLVLRPDHTFVASDYPQEAMPYVGSGVFDIRGEWDLVVINNHWALTLDTKANKSGTLYIVIFTLSHDADKIYLENFIMDDDETHRYFRLENSKDK
jgi:hypothetical protein